MPSSVEITAPQLSRLIGSPGAPTLIDVRPNQEITTASGLIPTAWPLCLRRVSHWASQYLSKRMVVYLTPRYQLVTPFTDGAETGLTKHADS
jgi:hypothetical protein